MPWGAVAAAVVGAAGSAHAAGEAGDTTKEGRRAAVEAGKKNDAEMRRSQQRVNSLLMPYAQQEGQAAAQLSAQMGFGGGNVVNGPGSGFAMGSDFGGGYRDETLDQRFIDELQHSIVVRNKQGGMRDSASMINAAQETLETLAKMKQSGELPGDFYIPEQDAIQGRDRWKDLTSMQAGRWGTRDASMPVYQGFGVDEQGNALTAEQYREQQAQGGAPGTPGEGGATMGGPQAQTIQSIMQRVGAAPGGSVDEAQFYADVNDPNYGMGMGYEENPAYQAMMKENMNRVNQYAANSGGLYSGARGEALREASANTQFKFQQDLANRQADQLGRRGNLLGADRSRGDQYYDNYMNILNTMASPTTATNMANIESGGTADMARNRTQTTNSVNSINMEGTAAANAATADMAGAIGQGIQGAYGAWANNRTPQAASTPSAVENMYMGN